MAKQRAATVAKGAVIERDLVTRWARRQIKDAASNDVGNGRVLALNELILWLKAQPARTKRAGGIGRR